MRFVSPLLALAESDFHAIAMWLIGGLVTTVIVLERITAIIERYKTKPPAHEVFASKEEVHDLAAKLDGISGGKWATRDELREAHGRIDSLNESLESMADKVTAALREDMAEHRKETKELTQALQSIHRSIGAIEGELKARRSK